MIELSKNQKIIIFGILIIMSTIIGYYIINMIKKSDEKIGSLDDDILLTSNENIVEENNNIVIYITGEVENSGVYHISENSRIADIIEMAGGLTNEANINNINLAQKVGDGQKIYIPSVEETNMEENTNDNNDYIEEQTGEELININTAMQTELETLPGIGPSTASKIISYRKESGKFKNIEEIQNVPGIGESKYTQIKDKITV